MRDCWKCGEPLGDGSDFCFLCRLDGNPTPVSFGAGRYIIQSKLGGGSFGVVFRCLDTQINRHVAVKKLIGSPQEIARSTSEIWSSGSLNHPNIAQLYDASVDAGYLVFEYLDGGNLADLMDQEPKFVQDSFARIALQICEGLKHAHISSIIHRDLKPANILLSADRSVFKVADFGLARELSGTDYAQTLAGTLPYMAPEVLLQQGYGRRADIYSLGVTFYQIWAGCYPFEPIGSPAGQGAMKITGSYTRLARTNSVIAYDVSQLVDEMLAPKDKRLRSVELVRQAIIRIEPPERQSVTIDDLQTDLGYIYALRNSSRDLLQLVGHLQSSLDAAIQASLWPDSTERKVRLEHYVPKTFAWLCALSSACNARISTVIWLKYAGECPQCETRPCECAPRSAASAPATNRMLLQKLSGKHLFDAPGPRAFGYYAGMFRGIYGERNGEQGLQDLAVKLYSQSHRLCDAVTRLPSMDLLNDATVLHLELSGFVAWFFALINQLDGVVDFDSAFTHMFARGCYACAAKPCRCPEVPPEVHLSAFA